MSPSWSIYPNILDRFAGGHTAWTRGNSSFESSIYPLLRVKILFENLAVASLAWCHSPRKSAPYLPTFLPPPSLSLYPTPLLPYYYDHPLLLAQHLATIIKVSLPLHMRNQPPVDIATPVLSKHSATSACNPLYCWMPIKFAETWKRNALEKGMGFVFMGDAEGDLRICRKLEIASGKVGDLVLCQFRQPDLSCWLRGSIKKRRHSWAQECTNYRSVTLWWPLAGARGEGR